MGAVSRLTAGTRRTLLHPPSSYLQGELVAPLTAAKDTRSTHSTARESVQSPCLGQWEEVIVSLLWLSLRVWAAARQQDTCSLIGRSSLPALPSSMAWAMQSSYFLYGC